MNTGRLTRRPCPRPWWSVLMPASAFIFRYFYRACQNSLVPSPVQVGRRSDASPAEARGIIRSHGSPKPPFPSTVKFSPKVCDKKDPNTAPRSTSQADSSRVSDGGKGSCSRVPTKTDSILNTKDPPQLSDEPPLPPPSVPECLDKTLETSDLSLSSCMASTPLLTPTDSIQLKMPPDGELQCVKYMRTPECEAAVRPAESTEPLAEQLLHVSL